MTNQENKASQNNPSNGKDLTALRVTGSPSSHAEKGTANTLLEQARSTAGTAYESVAEKAAASLEERKAGLTGGLTSVADSIRRVSDTISDNDDQNAITEYSAKYAQTAAGKIEDVARYFENRDLRGVVRDVESYARRNPAIFIGSAFALGVIAARIFKSSPTPSASAARSTPGSKQRSTANDLKKNVDKGDEGRSMARAV